MHKSRRIAIGPAQRGERSIYYVPLVQYPKGKKDCTQQNSH